MKNCFYVKNVTKYKILGKNRKISGKNKKNSEKIGKIQKNSEKFGKIRKNSDIFVKNPTKMLIFFKACYAIKNLVLIFSKKTGSGP